MDYYTILTDAGRALEAAALAGKTTYTLAACALGDGTAPPEAKATALQNEVWRGPINAISQNNENPNWLVVETRVPPEDGGFTIREFGIYTDGGVLFAVGSYPESYKPVITEGTGVDLVVRVICEVSNAAAVTLLTDPSVVMASKKYVDEQIGKVPRRNVGDVYFHQGRTAPFGAVVADGGLLQREMYPALWAFAQAQDLVVSDTDWQKQATAQGSVGVYSTGDGTTTFRVPLLTDFMRGTIDPTKIGTWQGDAIRNITGKVGGYHDIYNSLATSAVYGAFRLNGAFGYAAGGTAKTYVYEFDASTVVPTATENRPKTLFLLPCIHAYDTIIPKAQADMQAMMTALNGKLDKVTYNDCPILQISNAAAVSLPVGVSTRIPLTHANIDTHGGAVNGNFVPPLNGYYHVSGIITPQAVRGISLSLYVNGVLAVRSGSTVYTLENSFGTSLSITLKLKVDDVVDVRATTTATEGVSRTLSAISCALSAHLVRSF